MTELVIIMRKGIETKFILESDGFKGNRQVDKKSAKREQDRIDLQIKEKELCREVERNERIANELKAKKNDLMIEFEQ